MYPKYHCQNPSCDKSFTGEQIGTEVSQVVKHLEAGTIKFNVESQYVFLVIDEHSRVGHPVVPAYLPHRCANGDIGMSKLIGFQKHMNAT